MNKEIPAGNIFTKFGIKSPREFLKKLDLNNDGVSRDELKANKSHQFSKLEKNFIKALKNDLFEKLGSLVKDGRHRRTWRSRFTPAYQEYLTMADLNEYTNLQLKSPNVAVERCSTHGERVSQLANSPLVCKDGSNSGVVEMLKLINTKPNIKRVNLSMGTHAEKYLVPDALWKALEEGNREKARNLIKEGLDQKSPEYSPYENSYQVILALDNLVKSGKEVYIPLGNVGPQGFSLYSSLVAGVKVIGAINQSGQPIADLNAKSISPVTGYEDGYITTMITKENGLVKHSDPSSGIEFFEEEQELLTLVKALKENKGIAKEEDLNAFYENLKNGALSVLRKYPLKVLSGDFSKKIIPRKDFYSFLRKKQLIERANGEPENPKITLLIDSLERMPGEGYLLLGHLSSFISAFNNRRLMEIQVDHDSGEPYLLETERGTSFASPRFMKKEIDDSKN